MEYDYLTGDPGPSGPGAMGFASELRVDGVRRTSALRYTLRTIFHRHRRGLTGSDDTLARMLRVLVSLSPLMYRQVVAMCVWRARSDLAEVRIAPPEVAAAQIASFRPHLLVHDEAHGSDDPILEDALAAVPCRVEVLYSEGMHARLYAGGRSTEIRDASAEDLLRTVDGAARLAG